ncbi:MAG TPA: 2OG-Fe(II) oxygenase, partial [Paracoccaceae bacterium]|nr:2OG-Fe(II) oxygenase [Paracoccaceae bacterium]
MPDARLAALDGQRNSAALDETGGAVFGPLLTAAECAALRKLWEEDLFRSRIDMRRHGFGSGEYRYFANPLPEPIAALRAAAYRRLAPIANAWAERLDDGFRAPPTLDEMLARCHAAGQTRPTPLLLSYSAGDYNCLHQDLYGEIAFPLQLVVQLSRPGEDFAGGEFVLVEQRPRMQSRPTVLAPAQGHGVVFATSRKPRRGARGWTTSIMRHGVSQLTSGSRMTLGIIFHDAT